MNVPDESQRLADVYSGYRKDRNRWNPHNPGNRIIRVERQAAILALLKAHGLLERLSRLNILDVGCGHGSDLEHLWRLGAAVDNLLGIDLLPDHIEVARKAHPAFHFQCGNGEALGLPDASFDLVIVSTVFSSILSNQVAANVAAEIKRVLRPGGAVLWCDFRYNNPYNKHVRGISVQTLRHLFTDFRTDLRLITLLPPLARRLGGLTRGLYPLLSMLPWLRTHYVGLLVKPLS